MSMRVCTEIPTGKLIEAQSGAAPYGTLRANALAAGHNPANVEERVVSQAEYRSHSTSGPVGCKAPPCA